MNSSPKRFLVFVIVAVVVLFAGGLFLVLSQGKFRGLEPFPVGTYLESPANLHGNRYVLDAWIESQLVWREAVGRILEVRPADGQPKVAVFVAVSLPQNLYVGQRYRMDVRVKSGGLIYVQDLEKY